MRQGRVVAPQQPQPRAERAQGRTQGREREQEQRPVARQQDRVGANAGKLGAPWHAVRRCNGRDAKHRGRCAQERHQDTRDEGVAQEQPEHRLHHLSLCLFRSPVHEGALNSAPLVV